MTMHSPSARCTRCPMNRRNFLAGGGAAAAGTLGWLATPGWLHAARPAGRLRIRIVYSLHGDTQPRPDWPNQGFDFRPVMARINAELARRCAHFEFVPSLAKGEADAKQILADDQASGGVDGYLVYQMNCWNRVVQTLATSNRPVLYADFQFGGNAPPGPATSPRARTR